MEEIKKNIALLSYYVNTFSSKYSDKQIGKTYLQKIMFISKKNKIINSNYSLYNYGPFSIEIANDIEMANTSGFIDITWIGDNGYDIKSKNPPTFEKYLSREDIEKANNIIEKYHQYNAVQISIIATALMIKDSYSTYNDLVKAVNEIKPMYSIEFISALLNSAGISPGIS